MHNGFANSGHYYSLIKEKEQSEDYGDEWLEFNDSCVQKYEIDYLESETFGCGKSTT